MFQDVALELVSDAGQPLRVAAWRLQGRDAGPHVYLQAGIHADEIAGMLVLHKLMPRLLQTQALGQLRGTVTLVPQANPLGIGQFRNGRLLGRFHEATQRNFNRHFIESAAQQGPSTTFVTWQQAILGLAREAQIVLDLHTDAEALPYLYVNRCFWPAARDLAAALAAEAAILWEHDDAGAFETAIVTHWQQEQCIQGRLAATIELRGQSDVSDALANSDADGIYTFLCGRGVIDDSRKLPDWSGQAVPMAQMEAVLAPVSGVLVYECELGQQVAAGERIARIIAHPGDPASEQILRAPQAGRVVTRSRERLIAQGSVALKLSGSRQSANWRGAALDA